MKVVATFHPPSSVVGSAACHLSTDKDVHHLVVATSSRLEVYVAADEGLRLLCSTEIWGRIVSLKKWPAPKDPVADSIVALTDHPDPRLICFTFNSANASLERAHVVSLAERGGVRPAEFLHDVFISPDGKNAVVSVYTGKLRVVMFDAEKNKFRDFDVTCQEYNLLSLAFLESRKNKYQVALLSLDHEERIRLYSRELDTDNVELSPNLSHYLRPCIPNIGLKTLTDPAPSLIPVQNFGVDEEEFLGGVLVIGGAKIRLYEGTDEEYRKKFKVLQKKNRVNEDKQGKPRASIPWPWAEVTAWCPALVDREHARFLISDGFGRTALLVLDTLFTYGGMTLLPLGETSPGATISYITNNVFFLGSHFGDSQLVRINREALVSSVIKPPSLYGAPTVDISTLGLQASFSAKGKGKATDDPRAGDSKSKGTIVAPKGVYLDIVDTRTNIAPIMDATLADTDGSGLPQIFTASGGKNTGSVRVIRNGADFTDLVHIEGAGNFTHIFPLRAWSDDPHDAYLLATDGLTTQLFRLGTSTSRIERLDPLLYSLKPTSPTLVAANIRQPVRTPERITYDNAPWIIQVTPERISLVDLDNRMQLATWVPSDIGEPYKGCEIACADVNESMILLAVSEKPSSLRATMARSWLVSIATLSCIPETPGKPFTLRVAVGFWDNSIELFHFGIPGQFTPYSPPLRLASLSSLPRSVLLHAFSPSETYLFAGLADGTALVCGVNKNAMGDKRAFAMGPSPVGLNKCVITGQTAVFACGSRAAVLSVQAGSLQHSPVLVKDITASAALAVPGWEECVLLSTQTHLVVGKVKGVNKMQIRSIAFGLDNPVRLTHEPVSRTLGVGCLKVDPTPVSYLEERDQTILSTFKVLDDTTYEVLSTYDCKPLEEITAVVTFMPPGDGAKTYYALGTMFNKEIVHDEPTSGRIILLLPGRDDGLALESETSVNGCVYALLCVEGHLVAAMNSAVMVFNFDNSTLEHVYTWNHDYIVTSLASHGRRIFDGDAVHSVSALDLEIGEDMRHASLKTVARNYGPLWPNALGAWSEDTVVGSNTDLNLFSFSVQKNGSQTVLERDGFFHADDVINKFITGSLHSSDDVHTPDLSAKQLFFTSSGRIGAILDMSTELSLHMSRLQRNLAAALSSGRDTSHAKWRSPSGARGTRSDADDGAVGFLDGDLLEHFLELAPGSTTFKKVMEGSSAAEKLEITYEHIRGILETMQGMH
ncbi:mono-functional DNA-alkylating methyl methanesulfonate N-term-domain-containing protein [Vararia minispora EC-137]|uniref:Mono-functional DNA-alkylating methyl methanesulfonate N-term-domain-containing protein n=1 Tax=Vararia minispora EC-137 TaxID=1314806 RepID=A0ACB8Q7D7_9AGAM|nr:mono-functional DNA-alkylating methyl methanesulfonate N-term-domain-containing protein [Vararia minispora EC-137]